MTKCNRQLTSGQIVPGHWSIVDFWTLARAVSHTGEPQEGLLSVYLDRGVIPYSEGGGLVHKPSESLDGYQLVMPGDFVLNNQQAWRGSVGVSRHRGIVSPAYLVFKLSPLLNQEFANYQFRDKRFVDQMMLCSQGVGDIQRQIKWPLLRKAKVFIPPVQEQRAIVAHLNRTTARIDALIEKKTLFIELLREKRQALIAHAVTKGLDTAVPMKHSKVEWLGQIPAHWIVWPSKRMFAVRSESARPDDRVLTASQKHGVLYQSDFMEIEGRRVVEVILGVENLKHVEPDDFIISMRSFQGGLEWCRLRGSTSFHYVMVTPIKHVWPAFFAYLFKSAPYIHALRRTSDLIRDGQELRYSNFIEVSLPVIPIEEQKKIATFLDRATSRIDTLVEKTERSIDLLREHRTALITAAVTGKIDLREAT